MEIIKDKGYGEKLIREAEERRLMRRRIYAATLKVLAWGWVTCVVILNVIGIYGMYITADTLYEAWDKITFVYSPFNVWNWSFTLLVLSPALLLFWIEGKLRV